MAVKSFRDLLVWQKAMLLVEETYRLTDGLPRVEEFGLKSQMRRAAISVPSNIAEGHGRKYPGEFVQFLHIATGSLCELKTQLEISVRLSLLAPAPARTVEKQCDEVGKMLHGLLNSIRYRRTPTTSP